MIAQTAILLLFAIAIWLLSNKPPSAWGWVAGLASQPFWLWETAHADLAASLERRDFAWKRRVLPKSQAENVEPD